MPTDPGPYDLTTTPSILAPDGRATPKDMSPAFFEELGTQFGDFKGHVLVMRYAFDAPWDTWEMHPHGDEIVVLLSGDVDFVLHDEDGENILRVNESGRYVIVPRGTWHTARPHAPTSMLFVTPGEGTLNAEAPGD